MANTRSAEKQRRQAEKRNERNRASKSRLRSSLKKTRGTIAQAEGTVEPSIISGGYSAVDKAAKSGVIKKNTASRYKSRIAAAAKRAEKK
jgi:small subunit ribosomal protein S20